MARRSRYSVASLRRSSAGWMPARIGRLSPGVRRRYPVTIRKPRFPLTAGCCKVVDSQTSFMLCQGVGVGNFQRSEFWSDILSPTPQPWVESAAITGSCFQMLHRKQKHALETISYAYAVVATKCLQLKR